MLLYNVIVLLLSISFTSYNYSLLYNVIVLLLSIYLKITTTCYYIM